MPIIGSHKPEGWGVKNQMIVLKIFVLKKKNGTRIFAEETDLKTDLKLTTSIDNIVLSKMLAFFLIRFSIRLYRGNLRSIFL